MIPALPSRRVLIETTETLAIALAGGLTFTYLGLPAGLVSGSVLAVATAALLGRPVRLPLLLARFCYVIVGILLGAVVTPETLRGVTTWPVSIALLMLCSVVMMLATSSYLRVVHRLGSALRALGRQSRRHGAGDRVVVGARRRSARHRHRADHARLVDRHRPAERARFVRAGGAGGRGGARPRRRLRARANDPAWSRSRSASPLRFYICDSRAG